MQISCFMQSSILTFYGGILSNDLDFSKLNFVTKIPNFRSSKGPNKKCFLIRELQIRKLFHWHYVFTQAWNLEQEPKWALPKIFARCVEIMRCDEIMRRDEIRWFDGTTLTLLHTGIGCEECRATARMVLPLDARGDELAGVCQVTPFCPVFAKQYLWPKIVTKL